MTKASPLISIALCTYNGEKYLIEQLDSLVNQTYKNFEIIAIDDNSSDNSYSILEDYSKNYPFLKVEKNNQNLGFTKNFEKAIQKCTGDYIAISDQDDIWKLDKLATLFAEIGENMLIYHNSELVDSFGKPIENLKLSDRTKPYTGTKNIYFVANNSISGHASMFKKELLKYVLPFDGRFYYDWWIAFVAISIGTIKYIPNSLVYFRQHGNNVSDILSLKGEKVLKNGNSYFNFNLDWIKKLSEFKHCKNQ
jgi:glycosyltransferase involved in cell wall biosynthesis